MAKKPRRKNLRPPGKCIFCGGGPMSREHFWPQWASEYLPQYPQEQYDEVLVTFNKKTFMVGPPRTKTKNGRVWTKKMKVVCKPCNETWMSCLEEKVKAVLIPIMTSASHTITAESATIISQWVALKVMISEHNKRDDAGDIVTTPPMRAEFKDSLAIPESLKIWIARCGVDGWASAFRRDAATVSLTPTAVPSDEFKNIQAITFGIGDLYVHVLHTTVQDLNLELPILDGNAMAQLYPVSGDIVWPLTRGLSANEANYVSGMLDRTLQSSNVHWKPMPKKAG